MHFWDAEVRAVRRGQSSSGRFNTPLIGDDKVHGSQTRISNAALLLGSSSSD